MLSQDQNQRIHLPRHFLKCVPFQVCAILNSSNVLHSTADPLFGLKELLAWTNSDSLGEQAGICQSNLLESCSQFQETLFASAAAQNKYWPLFKCRNRTLHCRIGVLQRSLRAKGFFFSQRMLRVGSHLGKPIAEGFVQLRLSLRVNRVAGIATNEREIRCNGTRIFKRVVVDDRHAMKPMVVLSIIYTALFVLNSILRLHLLDPTVCHYDQKCYSLSKNMSEFFAVIGTEHRRPVELFL